MRDPEDRPVDPQAPARPSELEALARDLGAFLSGSEDVFLDAGRRIAGLERRARSLVDGARAAGAFRTDGAEDPAAVLGDELARLVAHLRASREGVAEASRQLAGLSAQIDLMLRSQSHFESIPPTLRMLGLNTRIENARSNAQYAGMETVALEVRRLGDVVEPKFRGVFAHAASLLETVRQAIQAAQGFLGGQDATGADMLAEARGALGSLQAMARSGAEIADRAVAASERLTRHLGALLVALQGHDATRQALEHVMAELRELAAEGAGGAADGWREHLTAGARVMAAQIGGARERFVASLEGLAGSLRAVAGIGAELSGDAERFAASATGASAAAVVRHAVDRTVNGLLQHTAHEATTVHSMARVVSTVDEMGRAVKEILGIGSAVKIIALNALVETERAGQDGRVLAVLAQGIGTLAGEVVQRTGEVAGALREISGLAATLRASADRGGAAEGDAIAGGLERLSVRLSELQRGLGAAVASMHQESRALGEEVAALDARVAEARSGADRLARVEAALGALGAEDADAEGAEARRARAYARYTMESERAIHDGVVGGAARPDGISDVAPDAGADGLGGNVELF